MKKTTKRDILVILFVFTLLWVAFTVVLYVGGMSDVFGPHELVKSMGMSALLLVGGGVFLSVLITGVNYIDNRYGD